MAMFLESTTLVEEAPKSASFLELMEEIVSNSEELAELMESTIQEEYAILTEDIDEPAKEAKGRSLSHKFKRALQKIYIKIRKVIKAVFDKIKSVFKKTSAKTVAGETEFGTFNKAIYQVLLNVIKEIPYKINLVNKGADFDYSGTIAGWVAGVSISLNEAKKTTELISFTHKEYNQIVDAMTSSEREIDKYAKSTLESDGEVKVADKDFAIGLNSLARLLSKVSAEFVLSQTKQEK